MKVFLSWLREFAEFTQDHQEIAVAMNDLGMAVESMEILGGDVPGVITAKVLQLRPHPDADKIQLVDISTGGEEQLQICCGAKNLTVGDVVPLATLGTVMPDGMKIERRKMRGEWSEGMLCSRKELGLGDEHAGIYILPSDLPLGTSLSEALPQQSDVLFDLEINPNRPDAMSVSGVARDLAARFQIPFHYPNIGNAASPVQLQDHAQIVPFDEKLCRRFMICAFENIQNGSSPIWMAERLTASGMRPINVLVDISNYVMLELGQPSHVYDADTLTETIFGIRYANAGEKITTLDDVERTLENTDGVIVDSKDQPIAIAGVMGGSSTEVSNGTNKIYVEMAWFDPMSIAITSSRLGLRSEASMRFERGADFNIIDKAMHRFAELLVVTGAVSSVEANEKFELFTSERTMLNQFVGSQTSAPVSVRLQKITDLLGVSFTAQEVRVLLEPLGFVFIESDSNNQNVEVSVIIPSFRYDTKTETDIIEEIAQHFSYEKIPHVQLATKQTGHLSENQSLRRKLRQVLISQGYDEALPLPFLSPSDISKIGFQNEVVTVHNPLAVEESILRPSLLAGLLKAVKYNQSHRRNSVALFEIGTVFAPYPSNDEPVTTQSPVNESEFIGSIAVGIKADGSSFAGKDAYQSSRVLLENLGITQTSLIQGKKIQELREKNQGVVDSLLVGLHPTRRAIICVDSNLDPTNDSQSGSHQILGAIGEIEPTISESFGISGRVVWMYCNVAQLQRYQNQTKMYRLVSKYPISEFDLAFNVPKQHSAETLRQVLFNAHELVVSVELFDVFYREADKTDTDSFEDFRSLTYRIRLQASDHTLNEEEVTRIRKVLLASAEIQANALLRL